MNSKINNFKKKALAMHGEKYTYPFDDFKWRNKIEIICPIHGKFKQKVNDHISGKGCMQCGILKRAKSHSVSNVEFIKRARKVHGDKYTYDKVEMKGIINRVVITCPKHGDFKQEGRNHLKGQICLKCSRETRNIGHEAFLKRARKVHGDRYQYPVKYRYNNQPIMITCAIHGDFLQAPANHMYGANCPKCQNESRRLPQATFIKNCKKIHGNRYGYDKVIYKGSFKEIIIICKIHGEFKQRALSHVQGHGCSKCNNSKGEDKISEYLDKKDIEYVREHKIYPFKFRYDFFLPKLNILIEYDGRQHFEPVNEWGGVDHFVETHRRDKEKTMLAKEENIRLVRIPYFKFKSINKILHKELVVSTL